ncbi:ABC transporter substrate-binding protein [Neorhizobium sp. JUb45]|uniref:ABC transporter substrate-binding protein n=1 Tax=unclassified Neorhizobium TaxID=2629175 RepID=UPI0010483BEE|nr:ABC transporter substrate-binding protein [Neorhizobium sp. JUb45]TCR02113.1 iron complex transport system substrate-binding protein [Neorhizobium sp. JUb45]
MAHVRRPSADETDRLLNPSRRQLLTGIATGLSAPALLGTGVLSMTASKARAADDSLLFKHVYGDVTLEQPASRVVSLGFTTQDSLLALGTPPVGIREWFGARPYAVWPWAESYLGDAKPTVISGEVSIEIVASLQPDLIIGVGSGISKAEYDVLSQVAPVLMQPVDNPSYGTRWDIQTEMFGRALGKVEKANELIARNRALFAAVRERHLDWAGKTAVCAYNFSGETGAFIGSDTRATFMAELGFKPTEKLVGLKTAQGFYAPQSPEDLSALDADLLVWISSFDTVPDIVALPMRKTLKAHRQGREVLAGALIAGALSFGSVLSLPFALGELEGDIALALDGDPATTVPSSVKAGLAP